MNVIEILIMSAIVVVSHAVAEALIQDGVAVYFVHLLGFWILYALCRSVVGLLRRNEDRLNGT